MPVPPARVAVAGPADGLERWTAALADRGLRPLPLPLTRTLAPVDPGPLQAALDRLRSGGYTWVVFTSARAVRAVGTRMPSGAPAFGGARVACVGPATATAVRAAGGRVVLVPEQAGAAALGQALAARLRAGEAVLFPRADNAGPALRRAVTGAGALLDDPVAYRSAAAPDGPALVRAALAQGCAAVVFTSGAAVAAFTAAGGPADLPAVCVGAATAAAAARQGLRRVATARAPAPEAVAAAVQTLLAGEGAWQ